jgi:DNA-directed RNA polymerase subunit L
VGTVTPFCITILAQHSYESQTRPHAAPDATEQQTACILKPSRQSLQDFAAVGTFGADQCTSMAPSNAAFDPQTCPLYVEEEEDTLASMLDVQQLRMKQEILVRYHVPHCTLAAYSTAMHMTMEFVMGRQSCSITRSIRSTQGLKCSVRHWQEHVIRLRVKCDEQAQEAARAAAERHVAALAAKQAELDAVAQQLQGECRQHRTAQASLNRYTVGVLMLCAMQYAGLVWCQSWLKLCILYVIHMFTQDASSIRRHSACPPVLHAGTVCLQWLAQSSAAATAQGAAIAASNRTPRTAAAAGQAADVLAALDACRTPCPGTAPELLPLAAPILLGTESKGIV